MCVYVLTRQGCLPPESSPCVYPPPPDLPCRLCDFFSKDESVPPRTRFMRYAIRSPRYGVEYGSTLLILLISLAFALISPLITLFGAAFCGGMWIYWR